MVVRELVAPRYLLTLVVIAITYLVAAKVGLLLAVSTAQVTTIWPPTAIALVIVFLGGYRYLPGILVGAFVANAITNEPPLVAVAIAVGNTLEALVGVWLLRRVVHLSQAFESSWDLVGYAVSVGLVATVISASIGTASLALGGIVAWSNFWWVWATWWAGDALAGLIMGPFLLVWTSQECRNALKGHAIEAGIALAVIAAASVVAFTMKTHPVWPIPLTAYITFPLFILAAFRFDRIGVTTATMIVLGTALWATLNGIGPFTVEGSVEFNLIFLQSFVLVLFMTSMFLAITVARRTRAEEGLQRLAKELKDSNDRVTNVLAEVMETIAPKTPRAK